MNALMVRVAAALSCLLTVLFFASCSSLKPANEVYRESNMLTVGDFHTMADSVVESIMRTGVIDRYQKKQRNPNDPVVIALGSFAMDSAFDVTFATGKKYRILYRYLREAFTNTGRVALSRYIVDPSEGDMRQDLIGDIRKLGFDDVVDPKTLPSLGAAAPTLILSGEYSKNEIRGRGARNEFVLTVTLTDVARGVEVWTKTMDTLKEDSN